MRKIRWGILSTAKIGRLQVIPAMQLSEYCDVVAIASRNQQHAAEVASSLGIAKSYGSYEALLADDDVDAIYNPLPNDLHVEWTIKALAANKHVLCEKPVALHTQQATQLLQASLQYPNLKVMEAFMYRFHPQWTKAKALVQDGSIGSLLTIQSFFSYYNVDPANIRNKKDAGGGGLMDIGCYCISLSRYLFDGEPNKAVGLVDIDPHMHTDRIASAILQFEKGTATFTCSTQMMPYQRVQIVGTSGRIEIEIPFNAPPQQPTYISLFTGSESQRITIEAVNQYTLQGNEFSKAILNNTAAPFTLEDAVNNMKVIDAIFESGRNGTWVFI